MSYEPIHDDIVYIDESGFSLAMRRTQGRSLVGSRDDARVKNVRAQNISLIAAVSSEKIWTFEITKGSVNSKKFEEYMSKLVEDLRLKGLKKVLLIMDNASIHKSEYLSNAVRESGHTHMFLPPYSPFLNPIENLFNQWKSIVRSKLPQNEHELHEAMKTAPDEINSIQLKSYFRHSRIYFSDCLNKTEILN